MRSASQAILRLRSDFSQVTSLPSWLLTRMPLSCRSRAIFAVSTLVCCTALLNCRDNVPRGSPADEGASTAPIVPAALALALRASNGRWEARAQGDSVVRMLVTSRRDDRSTSRLCGHLVTRSVAASAIPFGLPIDTTMPPLAIRLIDGDSVSGLRYLVPGKQGYYVFEGLSRDGSRRISVR